METTITTKTITYWDSELRTDFTKEMELVGKRKIYAEYNGKDQWKNIYKDIETGRYFAKSDGKFYEIYLTAKRELWYPQNPNGEVWRNKRYEISKCYTENSYKNNYEYEYDRVLDKYIFNNNEFKDYESLQLYVDAYNNKYGHLKHELEEYKSNLYRLNKLKIDIGWTNEFFNNTESGIAMKTALNEMIEDCEYCIEQIKEMIK